MGKPQGNKAANLMALRDAGFNVPAFLVFSADDKLSQVHAQVSSFFDSSTELAIRSSSALEDGTDQSFAGAFHTEINVKAETFDAAWAKVSASLDTSKDGIIVQEMIFGELSGVLFTNAEAQKAMINTLHGLCKPVVEGADCDHFEFEKNELVFSHIAENKTGLFYENNELVEQPITESAELSILKELVQVGFKIEAHFGKPQDIEWTYKNEQIVILQARPITKNPWLASETILYDSANVGESYGGIVSPLTATFAQNLYAQVYKDLLLHSGVKKKTLQKHAAVFDNLIGTAYGRIYYRMENWHKFMSMLPGYSRNKANLEEMLTLNIRSEKSENVVKPTLWIRLVYYPLVIWRLLFFKKSMTILDKETSAILNEYHSFDYSSLNESEVNKHIQTLFDGILRKWYLTVENDTVVMTLFAALGKKKSQEEMAKILRFQSASTAQISALSGLAKALKKEDKLFVVLESESFENFLIALNDFPRLKVQLSEYKLKYGGRFANELKLETKSIDEDQNAFRSLLITYANSPVFEAVRQTENGLDFLSKTFQKFASRREHFRLHRANLFAIIRKLVLRKADIWLERKIISNRGDIFYFKWPSVIDKKTPSPEEIESMKLERKKYETYQKIDAPAFFTVKNGRWPSIKQDNELSFQGMGVSVGEATGKALVTEEFKIPKEPFDILVTKRTDPGWTTLMAMSKGLVIEEGGVLSHASIVARELKIPAVIGVKNAYSNYKSGDVLSINGKTGQVFKQE
jgi:rifampicin phosphotransferase